VACLDLRAGGLVDPTAPVLNLALWAPFTVERRRRLGLHTDRSGPDQNVDRRPRLKKLYRRQLFGA
jgi:hypothetical protein